VSDPTHLVCATQWVDRQSRRLQRGGFLLEALVALLIFSFGVVAVIGLHGRAVQHVNEAQYRAEASSLAQATIAAMRTSDPATLAARYDAAAGGSDYRALLDQTKRLPGVTDRRNAPDVTISAGPSDTSREVRLIVYWEVAGNSTVHRHAVSAVVAGN
jgi:type IV pilus assembly protein PilV